MARPWKKYFQPILVTSNNYFALAMKFKPDWCYLAEKMSEVLINTNLLRKISANYPQNCTKKCCNLKIGHFKTFLSTPLCLKCGQSLIHNKIWVCMCCFMLFYLFNWDKINHYEEKCKKGQCCMKFWKKSLM